MEFKNWLNLPLIEKSGKIELLRDKVNPIYMQISDGSKLFFTFDEFKRISGTPSDGKTIIWKAQRNPKDTPQHTSKITFCKII